MAETPVNHNGNSTSPIDSSSCEECGGSGYVDHSGSLSYGDPGYGDPDGNGDLKRTNEIAIRAESILGFAIVVGLIGQLGIIACGIGLLISLPLTYVLQYVSYEDGIQQIKVDELEEIGKISE